MGNVKLPFRRKMQQPQAIAGSFETILNWQASYRRCRASRSRDPIHSGATSGIREPKVQPNTGPYNPNHPFRRIAKSGKTSMKKIRAYVTSSALVLLSMIAPALAEEVALGQKAFQRCSACHSTTDQIKPGPALGGIIGRPAGSIEGFRYSPAMRSSGLVWDEATLDRFLASPREVVPKTTMTVSVPKPEDRQNIIAYLKSLSQ